MDVTRELIPLLQSRKEALLLLEIETDALCSVPMEQMQACMDRRQKQIELMQALDVQINSLCARGGEEVKAAVDNSVNRGGLPAGLAEIFDLSMQARAVAGRIHVMEPLVRDRIEQEKAALMEKIESINNSGLAAASRYQASMQTSVSGSFVPLEGKKI